MTAPAASARSPGTARVRDRPDQTARARTQGKSVRADITGPAVPASDTTGPAGPLLVMARAEATVADRLRALAVVFALAATSAGVLAGAPDGPGPAGAAAGYAFVPVFGALSGYLGRESADHRRQSRWARRRAVRLQTIMAAGADMPADVRDSAWAQYADALFADPADLPKAAGRLRSRAASALSTTRAARTDP